MHRLVKRLLKVGRVEVVVCFGEAELGHHVSCQGGPSAVQRQYSIRPCIVCCHLGTELGQLVLDDGLKVGDFASGEKGSDRVAQTAMILVRRRREEGVVGAKPCREGRVLVEFAGLDVQFFKVVRVEHV